MPVKICLVSQEYPPETASGGIGTQTYFKAHGLTALGHSVVVLSRTSQKQGFEVSGAGVRVIRVSDAELPRDTEPARWLAYSAKIASVLSALQKKESFDLIDFPEWAGEGYVTVLNRTEWNRVPVVVHIHGPIVMFAEKTGWPEKDSEMYRVGREMEGTSLRLADRVFSSSHCCTKWCAENYGLKAEDIPRIHTGVDPEIFYPMDVAKAGRPSIVFAGRISEGKGIRHLVDAALLLAAEMPRLRLSIVGRDRNQLMDGLKKRADDAGFPELLDDRGFISHEEMCGVFSRAHVFAAPSVYEAGPGLVNLEAMACGLPVVASEGSGAAEVVIHGENGFLAAPANPESIRDALGKILRNEDLRGQMSQKALEFVRREALREDCLKRLESFYQSVVSSKERVS